MLAMSAVRMSPNYAPSGEGATARAVARAVRASGLTGQRAGLSLEAQRETDAPPRVEAATAVEGDAMTARVVPGEPQVGFAAFLDGIQRSHVRAHHGLIPVVHGAVAAAVRERRDRKLTVWETPLRSHALYVPLPLLDASLVESLSAQVALVDSLADYDKTTPLPRHPGDLSARALTAVQRERERAEQALATQWVTTRTDPLLMDGGIAGTEVVARSPYAVGAVKTHRTLYVVGDAMNVILGLREGERTTAIALSSPRRTAVATWYLRLREPEHRGPFFGLVRVEVALESADVITARADQVSRWLLAERAPIALPDARWDVMVYGIRECEQYLTAILNA